MAALLVAAGVLSYTTIKKTRQNRASKRASDSTRFDQLERDNAARIAHLQSNTCFCQSSDWQGGGCEVHGYVPPAPPGYMEEEEVGHDDDGVGAGEGQGRRRRRRRRRGNDDDGDDEAPAYEGEVRGTMTRGEGAGGGTYRYRRGEEDGALAEKQGAGLGPMAEEEVRRINEERRKRMKAGGFTNWVLRRKGKGNGGGAAGVR